MPASRPEVQHHCPAFARCCPKIPFFRRAVDTGQGLISPLGGGQMGRFHMTVKASAGAALMLAAGLFVSFAGPSPAAAAGQDSAAASKSESATSGKSVKHSSRDLKKRYAYRKHARASKSAEANKKAAEKDVADASGSTPSSIPEAVANANAQVISTEAAPDGAKDGVAKSMSEAMSAKANTVLLAAADKPAGMPAPADAAVTAPDQLNDVDRALQETPSTPTIAMAQVKPVEEAPVLTSNNDSSTLDQTSLIGKIFIAFGALLTMASAARMFMA
jgi:hypothetical protein